MTAFEAIQRELARYPGDTRFDDGYYGILIGAPFSRLSIEEMIRVFERTARNAELLVFVQDLDLSSFIDAAVVVDEARAYYSLDPQWSPAETTQRAARVPGATLQTRLFAAGHTTFVFCLGPAVVFHPFANQGLVFAPTNEELAALLG